MEKMQKCTQENLQQILQSAEQRPERLKAALNIIEHSDNTEEQKIKLLKNLRFLLMCDKEVMGSTGTPRHLQARPPNTKPPMIPP